MAKLGKSLQLAVSTAAVGTEQFLIERFICHRKINIIGVPDSQ